MFTVYIYMFVPSMFGNFGDAALKPNIPANEANETMVLITDHD